MKRIIYVLLALTLFALFGCAGDDSTSVTNPNANPFTPKGSVTGVLADTVTNQPIANADIYIMDRKATTGEQGQFTITDIPANTAVGTETGTGTTDPYNVVIDLTNVNKSIADFNAVAANTTKKALYPSISYTTASVSYTSLGETSGTSGLGTNHDTPVNGFVANIKPTVGKLDGFLKIQVVKASDQSNVNDATVELLSTNGPVLADNATGSNTVNAGHVVATSTTGTAGVYSFGPVEAGATFNVRATSADAKLNQGALFPVTTEGDNVTVSYLVQGPHTAVQLVPVDNVAPFLLATSPASLADVAASTNLDVTFTFSEPIKSTAYATALTKATSALGGLYQDVTVNFNGYKAAGNLPHTIAWSADRTKLTISILAADLQPAAKFSVDITAAVANLKDDAGKLVVASAVPYTVSFTTNGTSALAAPVITQLLPSPSVVGWTQVPNALDYKATVQRFLNGAKDGAAVTSALLGGTTLTYDVSTNAATAPGFDSGAYTYTVSVQAVFSAGTAPNFSGPVSNVITLTDSQLAAPTVALPDLTKGAPFNFTWLPVAGATSYQYAVETVTAGIGGGYAAPVTVAVSQATVAVGAFTVGEQKVSYNVKFRSVNNNGTLGAYSAPLTIEDKVTPTITARAFSAAINLAGGTGTVASRDPALVVAGGTKDFTFTVSFGEVMSKASVQNLANWSVAKAANANNGTGNVGGVWVDGATPAKDILPTIKTVTYDPTVVGGNTVATVTVTYTQNGTADATTDVGHTVYNFTGIDVNSNTTSSSADAVDSSFGAAF